MRDKGYIKLSRKFFSNEMWKEAREFSECEAWLDLIQSARFEATDKAYSELIGGREISYSRGQYPASISFLMNRWRWSEKKVRYFLTKLKKKGMISTCNKQGMNVITLCKYDEYNPIEGEPKDEDKGVDNSKEINELYDALGKLKGELMGELKAEMQKMGQAEGNKKKKENKEKNIKESNTDVLDEKVSVPAPDEDKSKSDYEKFNDWIKSDAPNILKLQRQITEPQFLKMKGMYDTDQIIFILRSMDNYKDLTKKYVSVYQTFLNWAKREYA